MPNTPPGSVSRNDEPFDQSNPPRLCSILRPIPFDEIGRLRDLPFRVDADDLMLMIGETLFLSSSNAQLMIATE